MMCRPLVKFTNLRCRPDEKDSIAQERHDTQDARSTFFGIITSLDLIPFMVMLYCPSLSSEGASDRVFGRAIWLAEVVL